MPAIVLPGRAAAGTRPQGGFVPNRASWQAQYRRWFVMNNGTLTDYGRGAMFPVTLVGTPVTPLYDGSTMGVVARTERTAGIQRVWSIDRPTPLDLLSKVTLAYWVYFTTSFANNGLWGQGSGSTSTWLETSGPAGTTGPFFRGGSDLRNQFTEVLTIGEWQHLAWVSDGSANTTSYYRNGVLSQTKAGSCNSITAVEAGFQFHIGGFAFGTGGSSNCTDAYWADFRVYPWVLSGPQIWELYSPATRWQLYWTPGRTVYFPPPTPVTPDPVVPYSRFVHHTRRDVFRRRAS